MGGKRDNFRESERTQPGGEDVRKKALLRWIDKRWRYLGGRAPELASLMERVELDWLDRALADACLQLSRCRVVWRTSEGRLLRARLVARIEATASAQDPHSATA